jgi:DNA-binding CsgD family transcriptional regulator
MALSPRERAVTLKLRDQLQEQLTAALAEARRLLADVPPDVWRAAHDAGRWLARDGERLPRALELARVARVLLDPGADAKAKAQAAAFLTHDLPPRFRRPSAWRAWKVVGRQMAATWECSLDEALLRLLALSIERAADEAHKPQAVRLGKRWVTDARGRKRAVVPRDDLDLPDLLAWLTSIAYRHAADVAGTEPRGPRGGRGVEVLPVDAMEQIEAAARSGAAALAARRAAPATRLLTSGQRLSPQQERVVRLRAEGLSTREIATELECSEATVRVHLSHAARGRAPRARAD